MRSARSIRSLPFLVALALAGRPALAQKSATRPSRRSAARPAADSGSRVASDPALRALHWRLVGPFRGGRVAAVAGDPSKPLVFYFGAVDGGVWKSTNAGASWTNITDGRSEISSVGAIAVAPSDPNVIYVGGGEADFREDLTYGNGVSRSTDGGETWEHLGLDDARHIAAIRVDPGNPDVVYVAATGHAFGPNPMRGVYRSRDGGHTWQRVLFIDDSTAAIDLALDPANPRILYAAMWKFERYPWGFSAGGGHSGLFKSIDGGDTWTELTHNEGMPKALIGRIGIAVSPANPSRLYASVEAADSTGGIFRSDDAGATWTRVNADQKFMVRPWYFSGVTADPEDPNTVYVLNLGTWRSVDGGKTFSRIRAPHGDDHILWVDPHDPDRMIEGNDGGATVSMDGGESWSTQENQPTGQFYHVITDDQFPYRIYGAQQDLSTVSIANRSDNGAITQADWYWVGGGESGYIAPEPGNPNIVFAGTYMGTITRYDHRTNQERDVSVWLNNYDGYAAKDVPNRFQWTFPIVFSPHDPHTLYVTGNRVFKTTDEGTSWQAISPDLTLHDPKTLGPVGGPITKDMTGTEWYATIFAFAESPVQAGVLWAGSDDGLIHLSRDGGATWQDVTPNGMARFTRVSIIEPSHHDAGTAYVAANRYQLDDFHPYLYKTTDYGKTWTRIDNGIPVGAYTRTIREDPVRRGLLFAGTETGAYVSFDDGAHWQSIQLNLPRTSVRDLAIHGNDLIAATHGRAFWVLDDISPLRTLADSVRRADAYLFTPAQAVRFAAGNDREPGAGQNPPSGVIVDYFFATAPHDSATLTFKDSAGTVLRTFSSATHAADTSAAIGASSGHDSTRAGARSSRATTAQPRDTLPPTATPILPERTTDSASYEPSDSVVSTRAGMNRFVWNLRTESVHTVPGVVDDEGTTDGPMVPPGHYTVTLTVGDRTITRPITVIEDPRIGVSQRDLEAQYTLATHVRDTITALAKAVSRIGEIETQLHSWTDRTKKMAYAARVSASVKPLLATLDSIRGELAQMHAHADESTLHFPIKLYNKLLSLNEMVQSADAAPTQAEQGVYRELTSQLNTQLGRLDALETGELAAFNRMMKSLNVPAVVTPSSAARSAPASRALPRSRSRSRHPTPPRAGG